MNLLSILPPSRRRARLFRLRRKWTELRQYRDGVLIMAPLMSDGEIAHHLERLLRREGRLRRAIAAVGASDGGVA